MKQSNEKPAKDDQEKQDEGVSPGQGILMELGGLGLIAHAVEMSEHLSTPGGQSQHTGGAAINIDPAQQLKPSKSFKPR